MPYWQGRPIDPSESHGPWEPAESVELEPPYDRDAYGRDADPRRHDEQDPELEYEGRWHRGPGPRDTARPVESYRRGDWEQPTYDTGRYGPAHDPHRVEPIRRAESIPYGGSEWTEEPPRPRLHDDHFGKGPKGYRRSDERLQDECCEILMRHAGIDASEIEVRTEDGVVTLTGRVGDRRTKRLAEDTVERVYGVHDVLNGITVDR
jgi:hypothetical protein